MAASRALELAEAHAEVHHRRPDALEAGFEHRRLQHVGRAHADALIALDAAFQELQLLD